MIVKYFLFCLTPFNTCTVPNFRSLKKLLYIMHLGHYFPMEYVAFRISLSSVVFSIIRLYNLCFLYICGFSSGFLIIYFVCLGDRETWKYNVTSGLWKLWVYVCAWEGRVRPSLLRRQVDWDQFILSAHEIVFLIWKQAQVHKKLHTSWVLLCQLSLWRECV